MTPPSLRRPRPYYGIRGQHVTGNGNLLLLWGLRRDGGMRGPVDGMGRAEPGDRAVAAGGAAQVEVAAGGATHMVDRPSTIDRPQGPAGTPAPHISTLSGRVW